MQNSTVETLISAMVIAVAIGFYLFAYTSTHTAAINGYELKASLGSVDGIANGADVRIHGIKIGAVTSIGMNPKTYRPFARLVIRNDIQIPTDSSVRIGSGILNGNPYLAIEPGRAGKMIAAGSTWKAN